jgi:aspartate beta-hydroxylase
MRTRISLELVYRNISFQVYKRGAKLGYFKSELQRSLYNVDHLHSTPFWTKVQTTYKDSLVEIQKYWQIIRDEGLKLLSKEGAFTNEAENLKETGDWKQLELFSKGAKTKNCHLAPMTCKVLEQFEAASTPTNCRVRCHLGLQVPEKTFIRVGDETRSWKEGDWLIFDDSFEHEVWHNGTSLRLVLIGNKLIPMPTYKLHIHQHYLFPVDVWHPELTAEEKRSLSPI